MVLAGHRILERLAASLTQARDRERALHALAGDRDGGFLKADDLEGGAEQFPRQAAQRAAEDLGQHADLRVGRGRIDNEDAVAVAFVDRLRPLDEGGALDAVQCNLAARAGGNVQADQRVTAAILGVRKAAEIAAAAKVTVAELVTLAAHLPGHRTRIHRYPP